MICIFSFLKFCRIGFLLRTHFVDLNQFKGNNSNIINGILTKLDVHQCIKATYICCKFQQILSICYLVMAPNEQI